MTKKQINKMVLIVIVALFAALFIGVHAHAEKGGNDMSNKIVKEVVIEGINVTVDVADQADETVLSSREYRWQTCKARAAEIGKKAGKTARQAKDHAALAWNEARGFYQGIKDGVLDGWNAAR